MFQQHQRSSQNQKAVTSSAVVAKAVLRQPNGRYEIIVVFQKSTRQEFYFRFQAKSPRSPQRAWRFAGYAQRDIQAPVKIYSDFGSYISHRIQLTGAQLVSQRMPQKRLLSGLLKKTEQESIYADWSPIEPVGPRSMDLVRRRIVNFNRRGLV